MDLKDILLWAREWNRYYRTSPKYRGGVKRKMAAIDNVKRLAKKEGKYVRH